MTDRPVTITAEVTLTIRVKCHDSWGLDCPMSQVLKQAADSACGALNSQAWHAHTGDDLAFAGEPIIVIKTVQP
jgi:hypothetical protein